MKKNKLITGSNEMLIIKSESKSLPIYREVGGGLKRIFITAVSISAITFFAQCQHTGKDNKYRSYSNSETESKIVIKDDETSLEIQYSGEINFTEDETAIKNISPGGYLKYKSNKIKIAAASNAKGEFQYDLFENGQKIEDAGEKKLMLANAIKVMIVQGLGAKERSARIYKNGGAKAILGEVENMQSDYVRSIYLDCLLNNNAATSEEMSLTAGKIQSLISSDFEKAKLLTKYSLAFLNSNTAAQAWLVAVKSIGSDFEKANTVKKVFKQQLTNEQFMQVLDITNSIGSDFEKANVLKELLSQPVTNERFGPSLNAADNIDSDFEKAGILKHLIEKGVFEGDNFNKLTNLVAKIGSDFEKANVFKKVPDKEIKSEPEWVNLINAVATINSDFEKANVLIAVAGKMPQSENVKSYFRKAAKTIDSEFEYGKLMKKVD
jgi:hypothetical protein